jgi:hypothetical protein
MVETSPGRFAAIRFQPRRATTTDDGVAHQRWSGRKHQNPPSHSGRASYPGMSSQTQFALVACSLKSVALLALIVADTNASPIPPAIGARGMGITSPDGDSMGIKVGGSDCCNPRKRSDKPGHDVRTSWIGCLSLRL